MLKASLVLLELGLVFIGASNSMGAVNTRRVYGEDYVLKGIYTDKSYSELERKTAKQDVYVTYFNEGDAFPSDFLTLCELKDKLPYIVFRSGCGSQAYISEVVSKLAQYNAPVLFAFECGSKELFRQTADTIHAKAPLTTVVWSISAENITDGQLPMLYAGDFYADWVALNLNIEADRNGIIADPYPLFEMLSYFEHSKNVIINLSVVSYSEEGHKYFSCEAAKQIEYVYKTAESAHVRLIDYISKSTDSGDASLSVSDRLMTAFADVCES
jgi:hypothetical protein